jgi:hypothetical protein
MTEDDVIIRLTHDQALVLSDWLNRSMGTQDFDALVNRDRAVWAPLYRIDGTLDTTLPEIFAHDYKARLHAARERLLEDLGDIGRPPEEAEDN